MWIKCLGSFVIMYFFLIKGYVFVDIEFIGGDLDEGNILW